MPTAPQIPDDIFARSGTVMGGPWQIRIAPKPGLDCPRAVNAGLAALELVNAQMSTYDSASDLMRLNHAPCDQWIDIPEDMHRVMLAADAIARDSDGALNIAMGGLVNAWGFGPNPAPRMIPDAAQARADDARTALGSFALRASPPSVMKTGPVQFDLCAIAKGFAVDQAAQALRAHGAESFLIEASGEIYGQGLRPDGSPWLVGLELPTPGQQVIYEHIALNGRAIATSGQYRNRREVAGKTYGHTISPLTGMPLESDLLSVTVCAKSVMEADGMATVILVLGEEQGFEYARRNKIAAQLICRAPDGAKLLATEEWVDALQPPA